MQVIRYVLADDDVSTEDLWYALIITTSISHVIIDTKNKLDALIDWENWDKSVSLNNDVDFSLTIKDSELAGVSIGKLKYLVL